MNGAKLMKKTTTTKLIVIKNYNIVAVNEKAQIVTTAIRNMHINKFLTVPKKTCFGTTSLEPNSFLSLPWGCYQTRDSVQILVKCPNINANQTLYNESPGLG